MNNNQLIKKSGLYLIGNLSSKMLFAVLVPLYAFYVSVNDLGTFDYAQTLMNIFMPFIYMAVWEGILKFILQKESEIEKKIFITNTLIFSCSITILLMTILILMSIFNINNSLIIKITLIMMISHAIGQIWQYYARALAYNKVYVNASILGTLVNFILVVVLVCALHMGLIGLTISYSIGQIAIMLYIESKIKILKQFKHEYVDIKLICNMLKFTFPIVLNLTSVWLMNGYNKLIISNTLGVGANGIYAFVSKFTVIISTFGSVISMALIEESIIKAGQEKLGEYFSTNIEKIFKYFLIMSITVLPIISFFYKFIINTPYYESKYLFPWFIIYAVFMSMSTNIGAVFQATENTKYIFYTTVIGAIITILTCNLLIARIGLLGAAISQILGAFSIMLSRYLFAKKFCEINIKKGQLCMIVSIYFVEAIICNTNNTYILVVMLFINLFIVYFCCYDEVYAIYKKVKKNFMVKNSAGDI